jgi:hypothetical protein
LSWKSNPPAMWPFSKKRHFPGVEQNSDGTINFALTDEEAHEGDCALKVFKGYAVHPDAADKIRNGTIAVALSRYANELVAFKCDPDSEAELKSNWPVIKETLEKAIAAVWKSYSLYSLPIFLYHRASFFQMLGEKEQAMELFTSFLKKQSEFKVEQIERMLLDYEGTNIEGALLHAKKAVGNV